MIVDATSCRGSGDSARALRLVAMREETPILGSEWDIYRGSTAHISEVLPCPQVDINPHHFDTAVGEQNLYDLIVGAVGFVVPQSTVGAMRLL